MAYQDLLLTTLQAEVTRIREIASDNLAALGNIPDLGAVESVFTQEGTQREILLIKLGCLAKLGEAFRANGLLDNAALKTLFEHVAQAKDETMGRPADDSKISEGSRAA